MEENKEAPGEVRSKTQVITRLLLLVIILIVVGGFLFALFRRPTQVLDEATTPSINLDFAQISS